jgi:succinate dehydrogenase / fumarate reductase flavoprotein subunit
MGGLWVDYNLESTIPGLFVLGEANFSDHGANRLGASALMQGLADGYFVIPATIAAHLAGRKLDAVTTDHAQFRAVESAVSARIEHLLAIDGLRSADDFHRELGLLMWDHCGMARQRDGLNQALERIRALRGEFSENLRVLGAGDELNRELEKAGRVADFLELAELMVQDAAHRNESCGGHFREEYQTEEGEALRDDANFCYVAAWEHAEQDGSPRWTLHKEPLAFEDVKLTQRSYK